MDFYDVLFAKKLNGGGGSGLTDDVKQALLDLAKNVAYTNQGGQTLYEALFNAFYPVASISAVFNQGASVIYNTDSLDVLKQYLTVTATYEDGTSGTVTGYTLSGTLEEGTSTITVSYGGKTTSFNVAVTWRANIDAFRICNSAETVSDGIVSDIYTTVNNNRATTDKLCFFAPSGTYTATCPTAYYFGMQIHSDSDSNPSYASTDFTNDGSAKTFWSGTARRLASTGWQNGTYTLTIEEDAWIMVNFKKGSAGNTNFNSSDLTTLLSNFSMVKVS
jgi:hypothetical protein